MNSTTELRQTSVAPEPRETLRLIRELLLHPRDVEEPAHRPELQRHESAGTQVHPLDQTRLRSLVDRLQASQIAELLDSLEPDQRLLVWGATRDEIGDAILERVSDDVREELVAARPQQGGMNLLNAFDLHNGRLRQIPVEREEDLRTLTPIWVDLVAPSSRVRAWVGERFGLELPDPDSLTDLEASARFYVEDNGEVHLHSDFLLDIGQQSRNVAVAFILHREILFSVRAEELPVFRLQRLRARTQPGYVTDGKDVLLDLYAADAEYSADALEDVYAALEDAGRHVLGTRVTDKDAEKILAEIAHAEDLNGRIRRNVLDTRRALSFLTRGKFLSVAQQEDARQIQRDIESLDGHTTFLFGKINFLMDATVGFININQNKIIKIFSVASVALLPPTLIASIYGMNFKGIPELEWGFGYPFALTLMVVSVAVPIWFFRKNGWLD